MMVPQPPSTITGTLREYLGLLAKALNDEPQFSYFTMNTPVGNINGVRGDIAIYNGPSTSTTTILWVNWSAYGVTSNQSWAQIASVP